MPKFDVFEKDGALFRRPAGREIALVDHVLNGERWEPYRGDRQKPVHFGDFLGVRDYDDELAKPKVKRRAA